MLPLFVMIALERIAAFFRRQRLNLNDALANAGVLGIGMVYGTAVNILIPFAVYQLLYDHARLITLPNTWWGWLLAFLIRDLIYYVDHRVAHRTGLFWAFHHVHHSSGEFNVTVAVRTFFLSSVITQPLFNLMPVLGLSLPMIAGVTAVTSLFGTFNHTRVINRLGWLDYVLATPSNHRVHHGSDPKYLDRNYGQVLMIWDWLFGTYQREEEEPTYGLTTPLTTYNPIRIELAGLQWLWRQMQSAERWADKLRYLYKPPGWRHDGPGQTADELRARPLQPVTVPELAELTT